MERPLVFIIEDDRDIAGLFRHVVDLAGYRSEIIGNGTVAIERLAHSQPDVIILDLSLPGKSGVEVLQYARRNGRLQHVPIIVATAHSGLAESLTVEPDLVMLKPVSAPQLSALVQRVAAVPHHKETAPFTGSPWDPLTGLYNREFFLWRLDSALQGMNTGGHERFGILSLRLSRFYPIDRQQSDGLLCALADLLRTCVRPTDTIARFEADRFFILIEQAPGPLIPRSIADRIQARLGSRFTCDIGVLVCDGRYKNVDEVLRDARAACSLAQAAGPGACLTFDYDSIAERAASS